MLLFRLRNSITQPLCIKYNIHHLLKHIIYNNYYLQGPLVVTSSKEPVHPRRLFGIFSPKKFYHERGWTVLENYSLYVRIVA